MICKLKRAYRNIKTGIQNLIFWFPVIWSDRWYDWFFLTKIMEHKLNHMSKMFEERGNFVGHEKTAKEIKICAILMKRISEDKYSENYSSISDSHKAQQRDVDYFCKLFKHLLSWWD